MNYLILLFSDELDSAVVGNVHCFTTVLNSKKTEPTVYPGLPIT